MGECKSFCSLILVLLLLACASGEDPYRFFNWNVTYGDIYPLGVKQQVPSFTHSILSKSLKWLLKYVFLITWQGILINGQFPGPQIDSVTNDNLIISVFNSLDEPFLLSWLVSSLLFFPSAFVCVCVLL